MDNRFPYVNRNGVGVGVKIAATRFTPAVRDYFNRLGALRVTAYDAANAALIDRLAGNGGNLWPASGAWCAMAGYLYPGNGANLIPLKDGHDAGSLNAFEPVDWNAVTGLKGDGSTKYVNSNRNNNADGRDDQAIGVFVTKAGTPVLGQGLIGSGISDQGTSSIFTAVGEVRSRSRTSSVDSSVVGAATGYAGISRDSSAGYIQSFFGNIATVSRQSATPFNAPIGVFVRLDAAGNTTGNYHDGRFNFYHIGPNLNGTGELTELDAALTEWKNALAAA